MITVNNFYKGQFVLIEGILFIFVPQCKTLSENSGPFGNSRTKDAINPSLGAWLRPSGPQTPLSGSTRTSLNDRWYNFHRWLWPLSMWVYPKSEDSSPLSSSPKSVNRGSQPKHPRPSRTGQRCPITTSGMTGYGLRLIIFSLLVVPGDPDMGVYPKIRSQVSV